MGKTRTTRGTGTAHKNRKKKQPETRFDQFHLFPKLPVELQLMIWSAWRQDEPILRHYMGLFSDTRFYAALNSATREFIETSARSAGSEGEEPLDPMEYNIRFTNGVHTKMGLYDNPLQTIFRTNSAYHRSDCHRLSPAFAWVNFEKDIFSIENISYRYGSRFRFLLHNIGAKVPKPLAPDHWASRIQTLALHTHCEAQQYDDPYWYYHAERDHVVSLLCPYSSSCHLSDVDDQVLRIMTSLKRILLVMRRFNLCDTTKSLISSANTKFGGYLDYSAIKSAHEQGQRFTTWRGTTCYHDLCPVQLKSSEIVDEIRHKLDGLRMEKVEVKLVVDTLSKF